MRGRGRDQRRLDERNGRSEQPDGLAVHGLSTAEALLVWGMRHWVSCLKARTDPIPLMTTGFGSGGVAAAVRPLEAILVITLDAATTARDVRCVHCATVGDGELDLLAAVAFEQARRPAEAHAKLREWLPPTSARLAKDLVAEIARAFQIRGLTVPLRREYGAGSHGWKHPDIRAAVPASHAVH